MSNVEVARFIASSHIGPHLSNERRNQRTSERKNTECDSLNFRIRPTQRTNNCTVINVGAEIDRIYISRPYK